MKRMLMFTALCLIVVATAVQSQSTTKTDPFNGTWKINLEKTQQFTGQKPSYEVITIKVENDVQEYVVDIASGENPRHKQGYTTKYNEAKWVPYMNYATGKANSEVMTIKVDERTQYRISRRTDGQASGIMMRRMAEDGKSYSSIDLDVNGKTNYIRVFERQ